MYYRGGVLYYCGVHAHCAMTPTLVEAYCTQDERMVDLSFFINGHRVFPGKAGQGRSPLFSLSEARGSWAINPTAPRCGTGRSKNSSRIRRAGRRRRRTTLTPRMRTMARVPAFGAGPRMSTTSSLRSARVEVQALKARGSVRAERLA